MRFTFAETMVERPGTGQTIPIWLPVPTDHEGVYKESLEDSSGPDAIKLQLGEEQRMASRALVAMALLYNAQLRQRIELGHECGVFALSCETADPLEDRQFPLGLDTRVDIRRIGQPKPITDDLRAGSNQYGQLLLTVTREITEPHIVVQATEGAEEPLYLSKIGTDGPVVLSDLGQIAGLYDSELVCAVSGLSPVPEPTLD